MDSVSPEPDAPPGFHQFEGQSPDGTGRCWFAIANDSLTSLLRATGNRHKLLEAFAIPEIVSSPKGSWQGWGRTGQEQALAYAGIPSGRYMSASIELPCPPGKVFVVYVSARPMQTGHLKIIKWGWVEGDPNRSGFPVDHETRFGRRLWPQD